MAAVVKGQLTVFCAVKVYNVPKSTFHDRVSGKVRQAWGISQVQILTCLVLKNGS